jgi:hypothetical protein
MRFVRRWPSWHCCSAGLEGTAQLDAGARGPASAIPEKVRMSLPVSAPQWERRSDICKLETRIVRAAQTDERQCVSLHGLML